MNRKLNKAWRLLLIGLIITILAGMALGEEVTDPSAGEPETVTTEEPTPTPTPVPSEEATPTPTPTPTPADDPTPTPTPVSADDPTPTPTPVPADETTPTPTPVPADETTPTPTPVPSDETTPTPTPVPSEETTPTPTPVPGPTDVPLPEWEIQGDVLIACRSNAALVTVPDGIREIGPNAFKELKTLEAVVLPDTVEKIDARAFAECEKLREVVLSTESKLKEIGSQAFLNCKKLNTGFVPEGVQVAGDAFDGIDPPEPTAVPTVTPTPTPTPTPAPTPEQPDEPEDEPEDEPGEEPEEEPTDIPAPMPWGGGGYWSGTIHGHARNTLAEAPEYDHISLDGLSEEATAAMTRLTLGGEELELALRRENEEETAFTVSSMNWEAGADHPELPPDTLVLSAEETGGTWRLNGAVLRRMDRSGILHLVLRTGEQIAVLETEGFLAGRRYDELKSRGTANRRFEYEIEMREDLPAQWRVTVEDEAFELTEDDRAEIYLSHVYQGPAEALDHPYEALYDDLKTE